MTPNTEHLTPGELILVIGEDNFICFGYFENNPSPIPLASLAGSIRDFGDSISYGISQTDIIIPYDKISEVEKILYNIDIGKK